LGGLPPAADQAEIGAPARGALDVSGRRAGSEARLLVQVGRQQPAEDPGIAAGQNSPRQLRAEAMKTDLVQAQPRSASSRASSVNVTVVSMLPPAGS
jgi:hypothetical protein